MANFTSFGSSTLISQREINRNGKAMIKKNEKEVKIVKIRPNCKRMFLAQYTFMNNEQREVASVCDTLKSTLQPCLCIVGYSKKLH